MMLLYNAVRFFTLMKLILSNRLDISRYTSSLMFQHSTMANVISSPMFKSLG